MLNTPDCFGRFALNLASMANKLDLFEVLFNFNMRAKNILVSKNFLESLAYIMDSSPVVVSQFFDDSFVETMSCIKVQKCYWGLEE